LLHAPGHDLILTRILWLCGEEVGWNRLGAVDTQRRFIYLHGTQDEAQLGEPHSHGCIRMGNSDIAELAMLAPPGTRVWIVTEWPR
jgi:lipoprotein-anchoring transpeptidase ErfK/SrfK